MEKLPMCRMCLVQNVRMHVVINKDLQHLYEKLTDIPFVTEDNRSMLACFFCYVKLKQCCQLQRKCLEAERLFAQMLNMENPLINQGQLEFFGGFIKTTTENISIVDVGQNETIVVKEEFPGVCERLDDIIQPKEEYQTYEIELKNADYCSSDIEDMHAHHAESDSKDDEPFMVFKTEVADEQESIGPPAAKKPKLDMRRTRPEDTITAEQKQHGCSRKLSVGLKNIQKSHNRASKSVTTFNDPLTYTKTEANNSINDAALDSNNDDIRCKLSKKFIDSDNNGQQSVCVKEKCFKCDICERSFRKSYDLKRHTRIHTGEKPFKCYICQSSFSNKGYLTTHIRTHTGEKRFKCDICQRSFSKKSNLTCHIRVHTGEKPFKCDICQRCFSHRTHLAIHIRVHTAEKRFKCDVCQRSFYQKVHLTTHIRVHTGEKPFKCDVCQRCFSNRSHLTNHSRTHTGEKPFKCDVCQVCFKRKSSLKSHALTHTGEKLFKCDKCQVCFYRKSSLTNHNRNRICEYTKKTCAVRGPSLERSSS